MVKGALAGLPGVRQVEVSLAEGTARVVFDPAQVTVDRMIQAVRWAGFGARAAGAQGR